MSQLNVDTIKKADGTGNLSVPAETGTVVTTASPSLGRRNIILNGSMAVAQRGTSGTDGSGYDSVDRWEYGTSGVDQMGWGSEQSTDAPSDSGFTRSYKLTVTTAETSIEAGEYIFAQQQIEAQNLQHLCYGTSDAKSITLSFWVKSSLTGVAAIFIYQGDAARSYTTNYTINSANTWEYKTVTISGDTSGPINNHNGPGLNIRFHLAAGSDLTGGTANQWAAFTSANRAVGQTLNLAETLNATWQITGVQLEVGSVATPFEHRSYGEELALCQRYYQSSYNTGVSPGSSVDEFAGSNGGQGVYHAFGTNVSGGVASSIGSFVTQMRTRPTVTVYDHSGNSGKITTFDSGSSSTANQSYNSVRQSQRQIIVRTYQSSIFGFEYLYEADAEL